ncbi:MAG: hypothetical protein PHS60_11810, partial [Zavarzinia sp.]|nr:hypothetical protein [Zavarzinia sp.]
WNSARVSIRALDTATVNAAVTAWNSARVSIRALDTATVNTAVTAWNTARVSIRALNTATVNAAVTAWNTARVSIRALDTATVNAAVSAINGALTIVASPSGPSSIEGAATDLHRRLDRWAAAVATALGSAATSIGALSTDEVAGKAGWAQQRAELLAYHATKKAAGVATALRQPGIAIAEIDTAEVAANAAWALQRAELLVYAATKTAAAAARALRQPGLDIAAISTGEVTDSAVDLRARVVATIEAARGALTGATRSVTAVAPALATDLSADFAAAFRAVVGPTLGQRLDAVVTPIFALGGAPTVADRLDAAFADVFGEGGSTADLFGHLVASNDNLVAALTSLRNVVAANAAELAAARTAAAQAAALNAAQQAYEAQIAAAGAAAEQTAAVTLGQEIGLPEQSYYGRHVVAYARNEGDVYRTENINSSNGVERNLPRATALAEMLGDLGGQVREIIGGGSLPAYRVHVSDHNVEDSGTDQALWLWMDGEILGYAGASDYDAMARIYLDALDEHMTGLSAETQALLASVSWQDIPGGMSDLAEAVARATTPAPGYALGGTVTAGIYDVDSVTARLAGSEFVVRAPANNNETRPTLEYINRTGRLPWGGAAPAAAIAPARGDSAASVEAAMEHLAQRLDALLTSQQVEADGAADQRDSLRAEVVALRRTMDGVTALLTKLAARAA